MIRTVIARSSATDDRVRRIVLFGSRAKGLWREGSDIDLAVTGDELSQSDVWRWKDQLEERLFPWTVDLIVVDAHTNPDLLDHIRRVGIRVY